jgi:hypothetical protein
MIAQETTEKSRRRRRTLLTTSPAQNETAMPVSNAGPWARMMEREHARANSSPKNVLR